DGEMQGGLIRQLGDGIKFFYAQQLGTGSHHKQPREKELLQMPGRGPLDFKPLVQALKTIGYKGFTEIFMHPYPRGLPIMDTVPEITAEINRSRAYLDRLV
ncbi:MAG: sugar phosphate isomerase/epimerase, partial [Verrucomicrobiota bacterium]